MTEREQMIAAAKKFRDQLGSSVLMDQKDAYGVMADFALEAVKAERVKIAAELRHAMRIMSLDRFLEARIHQIIEKLEAKDVN